jgi:hypothetical protein
MASTRRRTAAVDHHHGANDLYTSRVEGDEATTDFDSQAGHSFDNHVHSFDIIVPGDLLAMIGFKCFRHIPLHGL